MNNRHIKWAAMIPLILGVLAVWSFLSKSTDSAGAALARVKEAFLAQAWVHVTYDSGRQEWCDLRTGTYACASEHGWRSFLDRTRNVEQGYSRDSDHVLETTPTVYPDGQVPPWSPQIVWEAVASFCADREAKALGRYTQLASALDTLDGQQVVRLDIYYLDSLEQKILVTQIWTDPQSRLPQRIRSRLPSALKEIYGTEFITGTCDFPATGPASVFDLGVPRNLRIVNQVNAAPAVGSETERLGQQAEKAALNFPQNYRAMVWHNRGSNELGSIQILYRRGGQLRGSNYFSLDAAKYPDCHLSLPATPAQMLAWTETQIPIQVGVWDGINVFRRSNVHPHVDVHKRTSVEVRRATTDSIPIWLSPENDLWRHRYDKTRNLQLVANRPETPPGCVTLSSGHAFYFLDPQKDYITVKVVYMTASDGSGQVSSETSLSGFARLPSGPWYAQKRLVTVQPDPRLPKQQPFVNEANIYVEVLQPKDLPDELFDGQKLLEGAEVETY